MSKENIDRMAILIIKHCFGSDISSFFTTDICCDVKFVSTFVEHAFKAAPEQGASCWLTALPIAEYGLLYPEGGFVLAFI